MLLGPGKVFSQLCQRCCFGKTLVTCPPLRKFPIFSGRNVVGGSGCIYPQRSVLLFFSCSRFHRMFQLRLWYIESQIFLESLIYHSFRNSINVVPVSSSIISGKARIHNRQYFHEICPGHFLSKKLFSITCFHYNSKDGLRGRCKDLLTKNFQSLVARSSL